MNETENLSFQNLDESTLYALSKESQLPEILPCPFCGGHARTLHAQPNDQLEFLWYIGCDNSPAYCPGHLWKLAPLYLSEEQAIEIWNQREVSTCPHVPEP